MNREEINETYQIDKNGIIQGPGKFEGEMLYVPYFYDKWNTADTDADAEGCELLEMIWKEKDCSPREEDNENASRNGV